MLIIVLLMRQFGNWQTSNEFQGSKLDSLEDKILIKNRKYIFQRRFKVTIPQISKEEPAFVAEKFIKRKSYIAVQAAFWQRFNQTPPCKKTIQHLLRTSLNRNKDNSGRRRTAPFEEKIELVRNILESNLHLARICIEKYGRHVEWKFAEVVLHRCLSKQCFCKYAANLQNNHAETRFQ